MPAKVYSSVLMQYVKPMVQRLQASAAEVQQAQQRLQQAQAATTTG